MKKRLLLLTQWCEPEPTFKGLAFAKELAKHQFEVEIVTGFPNYPGGKIYPGYKVRPIKKEIIDNIKITRLALYPSHDQSALKRIFNYVSFAASALIYCLFVSPKADVIYAYHPPLTVGIVAALVRNFRKVPVVYDIQDMWPDTLKATGMISNKHLLNFISKIAKWTYGHVDKITVLSPGFKKLLIERGVPEKKIEVIPNWCNENTLETKNTLIPTNFPKNNHFKIMFAGNMGKAQALDSILKAAEKIKEKPITFIFIGTGISAKELKKSAEESDLKNVHFLPPVPINQINEYFLQADALLVHLRKEPLFEITIPSKTQAYMAIGKPILMGVKGDASTLIHEAGCGLHFEPENVESIIESVLKMASLSQIELRQMGENASQYYKKQLSLEIGAKQFARLLMEVIRNKK